MISFRKIYSDGSWERIRMTTKKKDNYMDDPKKNKSDKNQTENLIYDGETLAEKKKKKQEYQDNNLNEG